ncbi:MAG: BMP family ABC transporter substrate-binding protein [Oscillospiraceae bacterium]|nr:BMP family ABC transporter substrate-binding protein [Oscillospiraceae bacterium]
MKKFLAMLLAAVMVFALAACGNKGNTPAAGGDQQQSDQTSQTDTAASNASKEVTNPDDVADSMTSADGKYEVAFVTDVGQLKDKSFNQGTYDGVKLYAAQKGLSYKYYQPANGDQATDDDRYDAMKAAVDGGAKVIVCAGFMQGGALERAAKEFTNVNFVFIDGWSMGLDNVAGIAFKEQECGFFAGYAIVKEGYDKIGFCGGGGGTNPACCRYGYGFAQGVNAAAAELGKTVDLNYTWQYGASFSASPEMQALAAGWYTNGTQVIFSAGGSIFQSITAAASANDGAVIGVDSDQSFDSDTVVTSALKGVGAAAAWAIGKSYDGSWAEIAGNNSANLGAAEGATGLPTATWSMKNYTVAEYEKQLADVIAGSIKIDDAVLENDAIKTANLSNVNLNYV